MFGLVHHVMHEFCHEPLPPLLFVDDNGKKSLVFQLFVGGKVNESHPGHLSIVKHRIRSTHPGIGKPHTRCIFNLFEIVHRIPSENVRVEKPPNEEKSVGFHHHTNLDIFVVNHRRVSKINLERNSPGVNWTYPCCSKRGVNSRWFVKREITGHPSNTSTCIVSR